MTRRGVTNAVDSEESVTAQSALTPRAQVRVDANGARCTRLVHGIARNA